MKRFILLFVFLIIQKFAFATVPVTFTNGTVADATEVNQNFNYFENKFSTTAGHDHDGSNSKLITTTGTIISGTWHATAVDPVYGGTGFASYASGDLMYATSSTVLAKRAIGTLGSIFIADTLLKEPNWLTPGTSGYALVSQGTGVNPKWTPFNGIVQVKNYQTGAVATGTTVIPLDDTIPQNTEGDQYMTLSITPTSATNKLKIDVVWEGANSNAGSTITVALFQDTTADALAACPINIPSANQFSQASFSYYMTAGTTSATTFKVRAGGTVGATTTFNGASAARFYGGSAVSSITITEIAN